MNREKIWLALLLLFAAAGLIPDASAGGGTKEVAIADGRCVVAVPHRWRRTPVTPDSSMKLRMEALPGKAVIGVFMAHVLERNGADLDLWLEHHLTHNIPTTYGEFRLESLDSLAAGRYEAKLIHATDLETFKEFGLYEALLCTQAHTIILSYAYDRTLGEKAKEQMVQILNSLQSSPEALKYAGRYEKGRIMGFEEFGLFLKLPLGWIPQGKRKSKYQIDVKWPGGTLKVSVFKYIPSGIVGLKRNLRKLLPGILMPDAVEPVSFGISGAQAYRLQMPASEVGSFKECIFGQSGRGGYAMILTSSAPSDRELFDKAVQEAVLIPSKDVYSTRRQAMGAFKKAIKESAIEEVQEALKTLILFSDNRQVVQEISKGLKAHDEEIALECAWAFERMGSESASLTLQRALKDRKINPRVRTECIRSIAAIGGEREKKALLKFQVESPKTCSPEQRSLLCEMIATF